MVESVWVMHDLAPPGGRLLKFDATTRLHRPRSQHLDAAQTWRGLRRYVFLIVLRRPSLVARILLFATVGATLLQPMRGDALRLQIRARAKVEAQVFSRGTDVVVRGRVRDARGRGISGVSVALSLTPPTAGPGGVGVHASARTGHTGHFEATWPRAKVPLRKEKTRVRAVFAGSPSHGAAKHDFVAHVGRPIADLEVEVHPARVTTDLKEVRISAFVGLVGVPQQGRDVLLTLDGVRVKSLSTQADGWAELRMPVSQLLPAGLHTLRVSTPDGHHINGRSVDVPVEVLHALAVTLRISSGPCDEGGTCIEGEVRSHRGSKQTAPVAGASITLHAERRRLGTLQAGSDGRFAARLRADVLAESFAPGAIGIVAEVRVAAPYYEVGWSPVIAVDVPPPSSPSEWLYGVFLLLVAAGFGLRRMGDLRRERALAKDLEAQAAGLPVNHVRHIGGAEATAAGGRAFRGVVLHGETGRPLPALLVLSGPDNHEIEASTGRFDVRDLAAGKWQVIVRAPEHEVLTLALSVPHDGTYDGCELLPHSCRAVVRGRFSAMIARHTGRAVDWRVETPALVEARWMRKRRRGHGAIRGAVNATDAALYGRRTEPSDLERVTQALAEADA